MEITNWLADAPLTAVPPPAWLSKLVSCVEAATRRPNIRKRLLLRSKSSPIPEGAIRLETLLFRYKSVFMFQLLNIQRINLRAGKSVSIGIKER